MKKRPKAKQRDAKADKQMAPPAGGLSSLMRTQAATPKMENTEKGRRDSGRSAIPWHQHITLFTVVIYTILQGFQLRVSSDSEYRQLRAYLGATALAVECCKLPNVPGPTPNIVETRNLVYVTIRNGGLTPARIKRAIINWMPIGYNVLYPTHLSYADSRPKETVLSTSMALLPGQNTTYRWPVDIAMVEAANAQRIRIVFYGHVDYVDVLETAHSLLFCWVYEGTPGGGHTVTGCPEHNGDKPEKTPWYKSLIP